MYSVISTLCVPWEVTNLGEGGGSFWVLKSISSKFFGRSSKSEVSHMLRVWRPKEEIQLSFDCGLSVCLLHISVLSHTCQTICLYLIPFFPLLLFTMCFLSLYFLISLFTFVCCLCIWVCMCFSVFLSVSFWKRPWYSIQPYFYQIRY